jgi:hypothetical protein
MTVVDQRSTAARPPDHPDGVLAAWFEPEHVDLGAKLPVDVGHEPRHLTFAADHIVIDLSRITRVDARDLDGRRDRLHQLVAAVLDRAEHSLGELGRRCSIFGGRHGCP